MSNVIHWDRYECSGGHTFNDERGCPVCDSEFWPTNKATYAKPHSARNYGDRYEGGDAYAMGRELNSAMIVEWRLLQLYRKDAKNTDALRDFNLQMARRHQLALLTLCAIRKAGRTSA